MKKIYTTVSVLMLTAAVSFGQGNIANMPAKAKLTSEVSEPASTVKVNTNNDKGPGQVLWSEDFTGGFPTGWYHQDNTGNGYVWTLDPGISNVTGDYTNATPIASTSGGNYMLLNGDGYNSPLPPSPVDMDAFFQTNGIMINGQANITVEFEQTFRLCCQSTASLDLVVSTDSTFASNVGTFDARGGVAINAASNDPDVKSINISSIAGGYTGKIWLRFHWSSGASHYYWMVDDIQVKESENNDLVVSNPYYGSLFVPYTRIPVSQIQPIDFSIFAENVAAADQTGSMLTADINGGTFTGTSAPMTIAVGNIDSLGSTTQFTPPTTTGVAYNVTLTVSSDSVDVSPSNNVATFPPFEVSDYTYAMDDYGPSGFGNGGGFNTNVTPPTEEFEAGNFYDIVANDVAYGVEVVVGSNTDAGAIIDAALYDVSSGSFVEVTGTRTSPYIVTAGDISANNAIQLVFPTPANVTAGVTYFPVVHAYAGSGEFYYGTSGSSPDGQGTAAQTSLIFYPNMAAPNSGENFYTTATPTVRLSLDPNFGAVSVDELNTDAFNFNVYPNPSNTGEFTINLNSVDAKNVNLTVANVVGQTIINKVVAVSGQTRETISLADYSKGVYFLTVNNETVKLIVE